MKRDVKLILQILFGCFMTALCGAGLMIVKYEFDKDMEKQYKAELIEKARLQKQSNPSK